MLNHVVLMKFKPEVGDADIRALEQALDGLPNKIMEIRVFEFGRDILRTERSYDFVIGFHYVVDGRLMAQVEGGPWVELKKGEIILLPRNASHTLASSKALKPEPASDIVLPPPGTGIYEVRYGGQGDETHIVCGYLGSDGADTPLASALPPMLTLIIAETPGGEWIAQSFAYAARQLANHEVGAATIIGRLSELMFVEAVRRYIEQLPPGETGWLAGLRDPAVGRALALMHTQPGRTWTADDLANEARLSRSVLSPKGSPR